VGIPTTEPFAVVSAAIAEAGIAKRIEPAIPKGVFPAPYQAVTVTTAFFKSLPMAVFPIVAVTVIVFPIVTVIVFAIVTVTVIVFAIITVFILLIIAITVFILLIIAISVFILQAVAVTVGPSTILSKGP
jgi:hypothetical protein